MQPRPSRIAALVVASRRRPGRPGERAGRARDQRRRATAADATCAEATAAQRRHHPHPGLPARPAARSRPSRSPTSRSTSRTRPARWSAPAPATRPGVFDIAAARERRSTTSARRFTVKIDTDTLPEGTALRNPKQVSLKRTLNLDADVFVTLPDRQRERRPRPARACRPCSSPVGGLVFALLLAHGRPRPLDDLRHDRPDQLRPRRADHLRRAGRLRRRPAAGHDLDRRHERHRRRRRDLGHRRRPARFGWLNDWALWRPLRTARHRPDRDDGREHRPVDLPAQHLPVLRRREQPQYSQFASPAPCAHRARPDHAEGHLRRWCSPRSS